MDSKIKVPKINAVDLRLIAVSSLHITDPISTIDFLEDDEKTFEIKKDEFGNSIFYEWNKGELFPTTLVKLSGAKITERVLIDYRITKIYFFLVKEVEL